MVRWFISHYLASRTPTKSNSYFAINVAIDFNETPCSEGRPSGNVRNEKFPDQSLKLSLNINRFMLKNTHKTIQIRAQVQ
jgi:hypothetical protein